MEALRATGTTNQGSFAHVKKRLPYRHGAMLTDEMARAMGAGKDHGLRHTYSEE